MVMDSSSSAGAFQEGSVLPQGSDSGMIAGHIADEEPPVVVYIPRQETLAVFSAQTGLTHKYSSVTNEDGVVKACVVVHVPQVPGRPQERTRAFYGEPKGDLYGALESAAGLALRHLRDEYGFVFYNCNYSTVVEYMQRLFLAQEVSRRTEEFEALQKEVAREEQEFEALQKEVARREQEFEALQKEVARNEQEVGRKRAEFEALQKEFVRDKQKFDEGVKDYEALQKKVAGQEQQLDELAQEVKDICGEFDDLLPVRAGGPCGFEYVGPPTPMNGYDQLALGLVEILQSVCDV